VSRRRDLYGDLGTPRPGYEPPQATTVTQHVLRGTLDHQVQADIAYTTRDLTVRFRLGPVFFVIQGMPAVRSARDWCAELLPVLDRLIPDLDAELTQQQAARAVLNGGEPAAAKAARRRA
jgi:hypothetical protein